MHYQLSSLHVCTRTYLGIVIDNVTLVKSYQYMEETVHVFFNAWMNEAHLMMLYWVGKPARRLSDKELKDANYLETVFRDACSWMSFTFNRDIIDWKYEVLIRKCFMDILQGQTAY